MDLTVVLVAPEGPLNVGAAARACANFAVPLVLVGPRCDVDSTEAKMMAAGAPEALRDARVCATLDQALHEMTERVAFSGVRKEAMTTRAFDLVVANELAARRGRTALLFGNERDGLSDDELRHATRVVRLPNVGYASLNLAQAVVSALTVCSLVEGDDGDPSVDDERAAKTDASGIERAVLVDAWLDGLATIDYFKRQTRTGFRPRLKTMVERLGLHPDDASLVTAMWRQVKHHVESKDSPRD